MRIIALILVLNKFFEVFVKLKILIITFSYLNLLQNVKFGGGFINLNLYFIVKLIIIVENKYPKQITKNQKI